MEQEKEFMVMLKIAAVIIVVDLIWIYMFMKDRFSPMVYKIQKEPMVVNPLYMFLSYFFLIMLIMIVIPKCMSLEEAFVIGCLTFGIYDFTNLATLKDYSVPVGVIDTLWGGVLFSIAYKVYNLE